MCRLHGAHGGAPKGKRNGRYRHGERTKEALALKRQMGEVLRTARSLLTGSRPVDDHAPQLRPRQTA